MGKPFPVEEAQWCSGIYILSKGLELKWFNLV